MPRGDGTGPLGEGPMTGRAAGYCAGYSVPGFANPAVGLGRGMAWGRGGGGGRGMAWRRGGGDRVGPFAVSGPLAGAGVAGEEVTSTEADMLKAQLAGLQAAVEQLAGRLEQIARAPEADKAEEK